MQREEILKKEISSRLQKALERQDKRSIRSLEAAMSERGSDITSYGAIRAYVQGEKLPPLTFLMEAADELSVRPEWLILGVGEVSAVEERVTGEAAMRHLIATHPELEGWPSEIRRLLMDLVARYVLQAPDGGRLLKESDAHLGARIWDEVAGDLVFLTSLPLRAWGFRKPAELSPKDRTAYLMSMLNALGIAMHGVEQGDLFEEHGESIVPTLRRAVDNPPELTEHDQYLVDDIRSILS